jgi:ATP synthase protein I
MPPDAAQAGAARRVPSPGGESAVTRRKRGWRTPSKPGGNEADGWAIVSYLIAGMLVYGGLGWLISRWTGLPAVLLPAGMVAGLVIALVMVVLRYGRS